MHRIIPSFLVLLLALPGMVPRQAAAQGPRLRAIRFVGEGSAIRIVARRRGLLDGTLGCWDSSYAFVRTSGETQVLPLAEMDSIWSYTSTTQILSTAAGVIAGTALGIMLAYRSGELFRESEQRPLLLFTMMLGPAVLGGIIGSKLGEGERNWRLEYPR